MKAVGPTPNPDSPGLHRTEATIAAALPDHALIPRLLGSHDEDGWVALVFTDVDGRMPAQPWRPAELDRVMTAMTDLATALTPATVDAPTFAGRWAEDFTGWDTLRDGR